MAYATVQTATPDHEYGEGSELAVINQSRQHNFLVSPVGRMTFESRGHGHKPNRVTGFTLLELLVVMVILGLLASYVGPKYFAQIGRSEAVVAKSQMEAFEKALDAYRIDVGQYPTTEEGLQALMVRPASSSSRWNGPYLKKDIPPDPWGRPYIYHSPAEKSEYQVISYGKDGVPGGVGENEDIVRP